MCASAERESPRGRRRPIARFLHALYKCTFSKLFGSACRFAPSCSDYALEAIEVHGWLTGLAFATRRIFRCHPLNPGGFDPVP